MWMRNKLTEHKRFQWLARAAAHKEFQWLIKAAFMALLPLLCCVIACRMQGFGISDVYLPNSEWNDELFYYKQVESILHFGYPYGYFGFNESHALKLSFAAWSPVLVWPWVLWGLLFGWNLLSPIYCNLFLMTVTLALFVLLVKPSARQMGLFCILYCLFTPFTRYILSGMPEVICFCLLILVYSLAYRYLMIRQSARALILMFLLGILMTWMRPYLILVLFLPIFFWIRQNRKWTSVVCSLLILAGTLGVYAGINYYLSAEYFIPLFKTEWISRFWTQGILAGTKNVLGTLWGEGRVLLARAVEGFRSGLAEGSIFASFLFLAALLFCQAILSFRKKDNMWILYGHGAFSFAAMLAALLLMYVLTDGSKHLLTFIAAGILLVSLMETRYFKKAMAVGALCAYLFIIQANNPYDYQIPFYTQERAEDMAYWEQIFSSQLELETDSVPNYDNVVIWVFSDGGQLTNWQFLYELPKGFGISCCYGDYVSQNLTRLQSHYLTTVSEGPIDNQCRELGYPEIGRKGGIVVYDLEK